MSKYLVEYTRIALRQLNNMPTNEKTKVLDKINQYSQQPESLKNQVIKLQGRQGFRLRVGKWRVIFDCDGRVMHIQAINTRSKIYKRG